MDILTTPFNFGTPPDSPVGRTNDAVAEVFVKGLQSTNPGRTLSSKIYEDHPTGLCKVGFSYLEPVVAVFQTPQATLTLRAFSGGHTITTNQHISDLKSSLLGTGICSVPRTIPRNFWGVLVDLHGQYEATAEKLDNPRLRGPGTRRYLHDLWMQRKELIVLQHYLETAGADISKWLADFDAVDGSDHVLVAKARAKMRGWI